MLCQPTLRAFFLGAALLVSAAAQADETEEEEEHVTPPSQFDAYKRRVRKERDDA